MKCHRCEGDGKAHGADRPFDWTPEVGYPGPCPVCDGSGIEPSSLHIPDGYYFKDDADGGRLIKKDVPCGWCGKSISPHKPFNRCDDCMAAVEYGMSDH